MAASVVERVHGLLIAVHGFLPSCSVRRSETDSEGLRCAIAAGRDRECHQRQRLRKRENQLVWQLEIERLKQELQGARHSEY